MTAPRRQPSAGIFGETSAPEPVAAGRYGFVEPTHAEFPPILIIAVTNVCDMACTHCAHPVIKKDRDYRAAYMPPEVHSKIIEETKRFKDQLWVFRYAADGESMLHPHFLDFVEETKNAGIGPVDLTTNAQTFDEEKMRRLLEAPIDVVDISTDAYTKETYEKIRIKGDFDRVRANTERFLQLRDELGSPTKILVSIIHQKHAEEEIQAFVDYWGQYVDEVLVRGLNTDLGLVEAEETYFDEELTRWPCPQFWKRVTINMHGDVRFCVEDWRNEGVVANVMDSSIQEIWKSALYERFRELHLTGRWCEMTMCEKCMDWQHMEWDHGFEKAIKKVMG